MHGGHGRRIYMGRGARPMVNFSVKSPFLLRCGKDVSDMRFSFSMLRSAPR